MHPIIAQYFNLLSNKDGLIENQTSPNKESESPDSSVSYLSGRTDKHRTAFLTKFRTESGQLTESRQRTDTGQICQENSDRGHDFSGNYGQKQDKNGRRTVLSADVCREWCLDEPRTVFANLEQWIANLQRNVNIVWLSLI